MSDLQQTINDALYEKQKVADTTAMMQRMLKRYKAAAAGNFGVQAGDLSLLDAQRERDSVLRAVRLHQTRYIKGLEEGDQQKASLGLAHSYSRSKVKFNVNRQDNMIIQSISLLDTLDKDINTFSMRIKEWYGWHFPELVKIVSDNYKYARCVKAVKAKSSLSDESVDMLQEILDDDEGMAKQVVEAAKTSMGYDISEVDMTNVQTFADRVINLEEYRQRLREYLNSRMHSVAPNLSALIGEIVGARLISHAGSLTNLEIGRASCRERV